MRSARGRVWFLLRTKASSASAADLATFEGTPDWQGQPELQRLQSAFTNEVAERRAFRAAGAQLQAELEGERRAAQERKDSFKQAAEELSEKFKALSRDALKDNNQSFLQFAENSTLEKFQETAKGVGTRDRKRLTSW